MKSRRTIPTLIRFIRRASFATAIGLLAYVAITLRAVPKTKLQPAQSVAQNVHYKAPNQ